MDSFRIYTRDHILSFVNQRVGEEKWGEYVKTVSSLDEVSTIEARFVLLGIPEDIGVRANYGLGGTKTAWESTLKALLNIQSNPFLNGEEILVLGHFDIEEPTDQSMIGLRKKTAQIDSLVYPVIEKIVSAGKIPIVVGGGHNNAFPIIAGLHLGNGRQKVHVVNIDAHADLRLPTEGRHSGNGFSNALGSGFLDQYRIFGLQQNYVHQSLPSYLSAHQNIKALYFEEILLSNKSITAHWNPFIETLPSPCGLEIDLDSIAQVLSSATTPSGFALNDIRKLLLTNSKEFGYLHICEGAAQLSDGRIAHTIGKTIAYLISDFIKGYPI